MHKLLLALFFYVFTSPVFAHGDHGEHGGTIYSQLGVPIQAKQAKEFSYYVLVQFIQGGRLDKSWNAAEMIDTKTQTVNETKEWIVSYHNAKESDPDKKTIYIFLDEYGNPFSVNFTGEE